MSYVIGVIIGGVLMVALYELIVLPLLVGKPRALWGQWPVEAQSDVYERGFQAGMATAAVRAEQCKEMVKPRETLDFVAAGAVGPDTTGPDQAMTRRNAD